MNLRGLLSASLLLACVSVAPAETGASGDTPIRRLEGKHLTLLTDVPAAPEVDALVEVFDAAFPEWCKYFDRVPAQHASWRVTGYLMNSRERFSRAGHIPPEVSHFKNGFSWNDRLWLQDQTSDYYRRHLLLHEGTHSFMNMLLGGVGPPWYAEGIAELLATHRWQDGKLQLAYFPRRREEVPKLGRIEIMQHDARAGRTLSLADVFALDNWAHAHNEAYGWCWGAAAFLEGSPQHRQTFSKLRSAVARPGFDQQSAQLLGRGSHDIEDQWRIFVANVDYGYDFARMDVRFADGAPLTTGAREVKVAADRGWQPSGVRLEANRKYRLTANGRYQIVARPKVWWCEPGGVTIAYYHGMPLGILLAALRPDSNPDSDAEHTFAKPTAVGLEHVLSPSEAGTLYLRINDAAGRLGDNKGALSVRIAVDQ